MTKTQTHNARRTKSLSQDAAMLVGIGVFTIAVLGAVFAFTASNQQAAAIDETILVRPDSPTLGPADAPVTIVEFLDPECESCRAMFPVVKGILEQYRDRVRLVVRYFPLHNNSVLAAAATEAAGIQGKYWEMQELLFERQPEWGEQQTPQTALFVQYAQQLGLDIDRFSEDLQRVEFQERIARDQADGQSVGVNGTPTFFVNGKPVNQLSRSALVGAIEAELP